MVELIRKLKQMTVSIFASMDARTVKHLGLSVTLLVFVLVMFLFAGQWFNVETQKDVTKLMSGLSSSPYAIMGVIGFFSVLALTGFPQILLITATVFAFGGPLGALYSWVATMVSASLTFALGQQMGGAWVVKLGGARTEKTMGFLSRHGILASGMVRVVPSAPFIVVNAAAGASNIPFWKYSFGTSIGIIPKIGFVALLFMLAPNGDLEGTQTSLQESATGLGGIIGFFQGFSAKDFLIIGLMIPCWAAFLVLMRRLYLRLRNS